MSPKSDLRKTLEQRIPALSTREKIFFALLTGLFVFLFMIFFQPFGVNNYDPKESISAEFLIIMSLMGLFIALVIGTNELLIFQLIFRKDLRRYNWILWVIWSVLWLSTWVFLFYNYMGNWHDFILTSYFEFIGNIGALSIIPIASLLVYIRIRELDASLNQKNISLFGNEEEALLNFMAENEKDHFTIALKYLLYIESEDNYVAIYYRKEGSLHKELLRKSLKSLEIEEHHSALRRCHRSFIVNMKNVRELKGNRRSLQIYLEDVPDPIPVSRQYAESILELINPAPNYPK